MRRFQKLTGVVRCHFSFLSATAQTSATHKLSVDSEASLPKSLSLLCMPCVTSDLAGRNVESLASVAENTLYYGDNLDVLRRDMRDNR